MERNMHHRLIIIGSGPAGLTAALYAGRANLSPLVFEGIQPGGQLTITTEVENYPGFPTGVMGPELMDTFRTQALRFGATSLYRNITRVDFRARPFRLWADAEEYTADAVIVATGASARLLGLPSEKRYM
jgi:thioredoxin reductase (NADPH)